MVIARCCVAMKIDQVACLAGLAYSELAQMVYSAVRLGALNFIQGQKLITRVLETVSLQEEFEPFSLYLTCCLRNMRKGSQRCSCHDQGRYSGTCWIWKTSLIEFLAKEYSERGIKVGILTNDVVSAYDAMRIYHNLVERLRILPRKTCWAWSPEGAHTLP